MIVLRKGFRSALSHRRLVIGFVLLAALFPAPARAEQGGLPQGVIVASSAGYLGCFRVVGQPDRDHWCLVAFDTAGGVEVHVWSYAMSETATDPTGSISVSNAPDGRSVMQIETSLPELGRIDVQSTAGVGVIRGVSGCCGSVAFELQSHPTAGDPLVKAIHEPHLLSGTLGGNSIAADVYPDDFHWTGTTSGRFVGIPDYTQLPTG